MSPAERRRLALIAFAGHAPGLAMFASVRFTPTLRRTNVVAVAATLLAMAVAFVVAPPGSRWRWLLWAWLVGHFLWSFTLSGWILSGRGLVRREARAATVDG